MYRTILVPLDGSGFSEEALPLATLLARKLGAELHLAHVILPAPDVDFKTPQEDLAWKETIREGAERYLRDHAEPIESTGVSVLTAVLEGPVVSALEAYIEEQEVDLLGLTSHGAGGVERWWLGSVADRLLRGSHSDVLLVRPWDETADGPDRDHRFHRILVPLDGSEAAERALRPAAALSAAFEAALLLVRAVPKPMELTSIYGVRGVEIAGEGHRGRVLEAAEYLAEVAGRVNAGELETGVIESVGAAEGIVEGAQTHAADLVVLSSSGRSGVARMVIGSVADKVLRSTTRPVLVVRTGAT